jgi:hypothetical protein
MSVYTPHEGCSVLAKQYCNVHTSAEAKLVEQVTTAQSKILISHSGGASHDCTVEDAHIVVDQVMTAR